MWTKLKNHRRQHQTPNLPNYKGSLVVISGDLKVGIIYQGTNIFHQYVFETVRVVMGKVYFTYINIKPILIRHC